MDTDPPAASVAWNFKPIPFNIGAFILPFLFLLHFKKRRQAWGYFIAHFLVNLTHVSALILGLELIVGLVVGGKANAIMEESGLIQTQAAYKKSYIRWAIAGVVLGVIMGYLLYDISK